MKGMYFLEIKTQLNVRDFCKKVLLISFLMISYRALLFFTGQTKKDAQPRETEIVVGENFLADEEPHQIDMPNPYGGTTLIKSGLDLRKERSMTMEQFKKKFLDTKMKKFETKSRRSKNTPSNEDAQVRSWLKIVCSEVFWVEAGFKPTSS